jgi:two-component system CheB/CheR fusion protein
VVGIGASAGGIAAIGQFFEHMPGDSGLAFVVVLHLDPTQESHAAQVLAPHSRMPVVQAQHHMLIEPNRVYVIVPDRSLTVSDGRLRLSDLPGPRANRRPIDALFESLAHEYQDRAIGIVLSGTGSNGTAGMRAIKANGGMTIVQDPATAEFSGMPHSAIGAGAADFVLAPTAMPERLLQYVRHPYISVGERVAALESKEWERLSEILALLQVRTGHDFRSYRKPTLIRRIHRRMALKHSYRLGEYVAFLRDAPDEIEALVKDLLINVTSFFRDGEAWETLRLDVVRPLMLQRSEQDPIRVWVPGCATGEEAYSMAMLLVEELELANKHLDLTVFATDALPDALNQARLGIYPSSVVDDIPAERLRRFFDRREDTYQVKASLRELLTFAPQDLLQDPPFSKLDVVACRNVLIYIEGEVQAKLLTLLHFALRPGGYLFLGASETIGRQTEMFQPVSKKWRIYRRVGSPRHDLLQFPLTPLVRPGVPEMEKARGGGPSRGPRPADLVRQLLVERYAPASVLLDQRNRVLHFQGRTDLYLAQPAGEPTTDVLSMARDGLRAKLRIALQRAQREGIPVRVADAQVRRDERLVPVAIEVLPITAGGDGTLPQLLVTFLEEAAPSAAPTPTPAPIGESVAAGDQEREMEAVRDELRTTIEELETSNEDLKASNEEVVSMNEELQSTNEELETSKEELQSLNEELSTVNSQLQNKVEELESTSNDLANLLANTDIATIFLDTQFRIRTFTPKVNHLLDVLPTDVGRPLQHFAPKLKGSDLVTDARLVLERLAPAENEVETHAGRWYLHRTLPYRTRDNRIDGVVITFVDITERKLVERQLAELSQLMGIRADQRMALLQLLKEVGSAANQASTAEDALAAAVRLIAQHQSWALGHAYLCAGTVAECVPTSAWYVGQGLDADRLQATTMSVRLSRGTGFAGTVLETGAPIWVEELQGDPRWIRDEGLLGLKGAVFYPVLVQGEVRAVLAFYSNHPIATEAALETVLSSVSFQLAQVLERDETARGVAFAVENEQRQMGQELHDRLGQSLSAVGMLARSLQQKIETQAVPRAGELNPLVQGIEDAKAELRLLARGLLPVDLDVGGLSIALQELAAHCSELYQIACRFEGDEVTTFQDSTTAIQLFRIAQEAVRNAAEHGQAKRVVIQLSGADGQFTLQVKDDGIGFERDAARSRGLGIRIMHHRAHAVGASLDITTAPGQGTLVRCARVSR